MNNHRLKNHRTQQHHKETEKPSDTAGYTDSEKANFNSNWWKFQNWAIVPLKQWSFQIILKNLINKYHVFIFTDVFTFKIT